MKVARLGFNSFIGTRDLNCMHCALCVHTHVVRVYGRKWASERTEGCAYKYAQDSVKSVFNKCFINYIPSRSVLILQLKFTIDQIKTAFWNVLRVHKCVLENHLNSAAAKRM